MKVLGILQNPWVKDPVRVKAMMDRFGRRVILPKLLFMGGLTGRRLMDGLGEEWCNRIIWEEASAEIGGHSASVFKADPQHVAAVIADVKPDIIITLGRVARDVVTEVFTVKGPAIRVWVLPHPTARRLSPAEILAELKQCRTWLNRQTTDDTAA